MDDNQPNSNGPAAPQPGQTITPGSAAPMVDPAPTTPVPDAPLPSPEPPKVIAAHPVAPQSAVVPSIDSEGSITWTASEFVAHSKAASWYVLLAVAAVIAAAVIWILTKDTISSVVVLVAAGVFGFYGSRQPRQLQYALNEDGLTIGPRHFPLEQFRSFSIVTEGAFSSIVFMPFKRFAQLITIYYDPADEPKIIDMLADRLPHEERQKDMIDRLMWRIRF